MMNSITLFAVIISAAVILNTCNNYVNGEYTEKGNHWMNDGTVPNDKAKLKKFTSTMKGEFQRLWELQDAAGIAEKHTDECVYINKDKGILRGKVAVQKAYQDLFDSGKASVEPEFLAESDIGTLGDGYMYLIAAEHYFDKDNNRVGESKVLVILKHVEDGYKTYLISRITE
ncbi:uncharacterized protein [Amphiura filiformis]|uniref:uncharacterized protein n=1 Tax=Amphiura filiformis TaxID=82378 RepID=UPI003B20F11D